MTTPQSQAPAISQADRDILRRLAARVAELAARPCEQEKRDLWYRHNERQQTRPLIFCDPENGWHEILPQECLQCEGSIARRWEWTLRATIFWGEDMRDDRVILPFWDVGHAHTETDWGLQTTRIGDGGTSAYTWDAPIKDYSEMERMHFPVMTLDPDATARSMELASSVFGDILTVRNRASWWWTLGLTQTLVFLRGLEQMMWDMIERPEDLHRLMAFLRDGTNARLDFLEANGLLAPNWDGQYVGSGGFGWTHELPQPGYDGVVRLRDMWGFCESQETVGVSPAMFEEFIFPYQASIMERFGMNCYGCCEPLDKRWHVVKRLPHVRRVSVSAWADLRVMADCLRDDYVFSYKPNPAALATPTIDEDAIRASLREAMEITRGCCLEVVMKDCHTIGGDPEHVTRWTRIAREEADRIAG